MNIENFLFGILFLNIVYVNNRSVKRTPYDKSKILSNEFFKFHNFYSLKVNLKFKNSSSYSYRITYIKFLQFNIQ